MQRLGTWQPDRPRHQMGRPSSVRVTDASGMVRLVDKWTPARRFRASPTSRALPAAPVNSWQVRFDNGERETFVAAANGHVYRYALGAWTPISRAATAKRWSIARYGNKIYASEPGTILQKWEQGDSRMSDVTGAPTGAQRLAAFRDFLLAANFGGAGAQRVRWSELDAPEAWNDEGDNSAGAQKIPDLGAIHEIVTFEDVYLFCEEGIARMVLTGGELIFQVDVLTRDVGVAGPGTVVVVGRTIYVASTQGFLAMSVDADSAEIGTGAVSASYQAQADPLLSHVNYASYDRTRRLVQWSFAREQQDYPDTTFAYSLDSRSWGSYPEEHPVRFLQRSQGVTFATAARAFGNTFRELARVAPRFSSPRFAGGSETLHGFDSGRKAGPASGASAGHVDTALLSPLEGAGRWLLTGVRPLGEGNVQVYTRSYASLNPDSGGAWKAAEPLNAKGFAPCFASGRYLQLRFGFGDDAGINDYIQGFELDWQRDGRI